MPVNEWGYDYLRRAMEVFWRADAHDELLWYVKDGTVFLSAICSDVFAWGGADAEQIHPGQLDLLEQTFEDLKALYVGGEVKDDPTHWLGALFAARVRGERPQGAAYPKQRALQELFNACGPERERGLFNPHKIPDPED